MRALIFLSVVQVGLLILLFIRITALDSQVTAQLPAPPTNPVSSFSPPSKPPEVRPGDALSSNDEARLRRIIREELRSYPATGASSDQSVAESATSKPGNSFQLDRVSQKIDYFSSIGYISELEMGNLEMEIAKLDPAGRREMLRKLTQALNTGAIEGRF